MISDQESKYESNLLNVTYSHIPYEYVVRRLTALLVRDSKRVAESIKKLPQIGYIAADCYFIHYLLNPTVRTTANPDGLLEVIRRFFLNYVRSELYEKVRSHTVLNDRFSTVYSYFIVKHFVEDFLTIKSRLKYTLSSFTEFLTGGPKIGGRDSVWHPHGVLVSETLANAMSKSLRALEVVQDIEEIVGDLVGKEPGSYVKLIDLTNKIMKVDFADEILTMGKAISKAASWCGERWIRGKYGDEIWGYGYTNDVRETIPRELALPDDVFLVKVSSNRLLRREMMKQPISAIYVLVDKSGSMSVKLKTVWSRSVALALYRYAKSIGVRFYFRFFDVSTYDLISDKDPHRLLDDLIRVESGGGTCIDCAIREAVRDVTLKRIEDSTDVLVAVITDGKDEVKTAIETLKRANVRLVAVMVDGYNEDLRKLAVGSGGKFLKVIPNQSGGLAVVRAIREVGLR